VVGPTLVKSISRKIDERIFVNRYNIHKESHLHVDQSMCEKCEHKPCTYSCPVDNYVWDKETKRLTVYYEGCVECGACVVVCPYHKITLEYPPLGRGINYRFG